MAAMSSSCKARTRTFFDHKHRILTRHVCKNGEDTITTRHKLLPDIVHEVIGCSSNTAY